MTLIAVISLGCSGDDAARNGRTHLIPAVEAVQARYGSLPLNERLSGVVRANNQVGLFPEISAVVEAVHVENGDSVKKGQPLISLRDREFQERLKQARAALQIAQAQARQAEAKLKELQSGYKRAQALADKGLSNEAELETAETEALSARADLDLANARVEQVSATVAEEQEALTQTIVRAPITGTVGNRDAEVGMMVTPSSRLITIGQLDSVRVEVILTDRMLGYIESGQRAEIQTAGLPSGLASAPLSRISPFLHPITHSTKAEIDMVNPDHALKSGMFVTVDIHYGESENATLVPLSALYENPLTGGIGVFVARDSANKITGEQVAARDNAGLTDPVGFEFVPVEVIAKGRMSAGIAGIDPGDWIVTIGQDLFAGKIGQARVRPVEWAWVEHLQNVQREDLIQEIVGGKQATPKDTTVTGI